MSAVSPPMRAQPASRQAVGIPLTMRQLLRLRQVAAGEVVEEEEGLGAGGEDVVDAVVDEVDADGVVAAHERRRC